MSMKKTNNKKEDTMNIKLFEVRDRGTMIPVMATKLAAHEGTVEDWLLRHAGYGRDIGYIFLTRLVGCETHYDRFEWGQGSTMFQVHTELEENWDVYAGGEVIDVEYIRGDTKEPKKTERRYLWQ